MRIIRSTERGVRIVSALAVASGLFACSTTDATSTEESESALTACAANQEDLTVASREDRATAESERDPLLGEDGLTAPNIHILGVLEDTGCSSIEIKDPRDPPKHPPMPLPLPDNWNNRCPSYGPPESVKIDPTKCTVKSATLFTCDVPIDGRKKPITFECRRHEPGGKKKAKNEPCKFHCYVKEGQK